MERITISDSKSSTYIHRSKWIPYYFVINNNLKDWGQNQQIAISTTFISICNQWSIMSSCNVEFFENYRMLLSMSYAMLYKMENYIRKNNLPTIKIIIWIFMIIDADFTWNTNTFIFLVESHNTSIRINKLFLK